MEPGLLTEVAHGPEADHLQLVALSERTESTAPDIRHPPPAPGRRAAYFVRLNSNVFAPGCTVNAMPLVEVEA